MLRNMAGFVLGNTKMLSSSDSKHRKSGYVMPAITPTGSAPSSDKDAYPLHIDPMPVQNPSQKKERKILLYCTTYAGSVTTTSAKAKFASSPCTSLPLCLCEV